MLFNPTLFFAHETAVKEVLTVVVRRNIKY